MKKSSPKEEPSSRSISFKAYINKLVFFIRGLFYISVILKCISFFNKKVVPKIKKDEISIDLLKYKNVEEVMLPRSDIFAIKDDVKVSHLKQVIIHAHYSRILVYHGNLDNIVGFIYVKDIMRILLKKQDLQIKNIIQKPIISISSMKLTTLLNEMVKKSVYIAVVIDEYGCTSGIVTLKDIVKEIFDKINISIDKKVENNEYRILNPSTILSNCRVKIESLENLLGMKLKHKDDEFDTIGGLVLAKSGKVPAIGTKLEINNTIELEVIDATPRVLKKVMLKLKNVQ